MWQCQHLTRWSTGGVTGKAAAAAFGRVTGLPSRLDVWQTNLSWDAIDRRL